MKFIAYIYILLYPEFDKQSGIGAKLKQENIYTQFFF